MKKKNIIKISAIVFSIILVIVAITTTTQSYFNKDNYAKNPTEYQTGLLSIEAVSKSNNISLSNTLPMSDTEGGQIEPYVFTIRNNGNVDYKFNVKLLSTSDNTFSPEYIKLKIDDDGIRTLASLTDSIIKEDVILPAGETVDITLRVWLSSDTKNTEIGKTFNSKIVIDGQSIYTSTNQEADSPLKDFTYYLGSNTSSVSTIEYYNEEDGNYYDIPITPISLESNEILLTKYKGKSKNVTIPDTYTIGNKTYNVVILSSAYMNYNNGDIDDYEGIFMYNTNIESVYLNDKIKVVSEGSNGINSARDLFSGCTSLKNVPIIPSTVTSMHSTFYNCSSLVSVPNMPSEITDMTYTFYNCKSLINAPTIPSKVTTMTNTFSGCTSLVTAPEIPSKVVSMKNTFENCTSLVNAPLIPNGVTDMTGTFHGCTSLKNAPEIPSGVTKMTSTFYNCLSLKTAPVIPSTVTNMDTTFFGCAALTTAPTIPSGVTSMIGTFANCTSLKTAPTIPNKVTNMSTAFLNCTSLTTAPTIPASVTLMIQTFAGCTNLTGIVRINSSKVSDATGIFSGTSKSITLAVPSSSTTYTTMNALTTSNGKPSNVTLTTY